MNPSPTSVVGTLERLSIGVSRVSIRHGSTATRYTRYRKKNYAWTGYKRGHGESIFVFNHIQNGMIVYSHDPILKPDCQQALSQIPFTVKKQKPASFRTDYWRPLCMIQFEPGQGVVGRNVFHKLREIRQRHELDWDWQAAELQKMSRRERGEKIHNQKPNAVADIAAVLGGYGRGNLMWMPATEQSALPEPEAEAEAEVVEEDVAQEDVAEAGTPEGNQAQATQEGTTEASASDAAPTEEAAGEVTTTPRKVRKAVPAEPPRRLHNAIIYWANDMDLNWATKWSDNVDHKMGLPSDVRVRNWQTKVYYGEEAEIIEDRSEGPPEGPASTEGGASTGEQESPLEDAKLESEREPESEPAPKEEKKKGWLGWLGGKPGNSSQDART